MDKQSNNVLQNIIQKMIEQQESDKKKPRMKLGVPDEISIGQYNTLIFDYLRLWKPQFVGDLNMGNAIFI